MLMGQSDRTAVIVPKSLSGLWSCANHDPGDDLAAVVGGGGGDGG